ncbi:uncharacterized protein V6R79_024318 [Siganus canaliculatus]
MARCVPAVTVRSALTIKQQLTHHFPSDCPDISTLRPLANDFLTLTLLVFHYSYDSVESQSFPMTFL